ncbi:MAG: Uma2 family endonuclease [Gemmatimonadota bacterium]|nr:MAG: Uma2 family endonuclease [Gemmatimonadota bacterium]
MGMVAPVYYTAEMVQALPDDGNRYETVHGELLVNPAPQLWHQELVGRLAYELRAYLDRHPVGHVLTAPADISWGSDVLVQPDVFVADSAEVRTLDWANVRSLKLVVEVLSPTSSRSDRFTKRRLYQEVGIPVYWIVDPNDEVVEVWHPDWTLPRVERESVSWDPREASEPFSVELATLFRPL